MEIEKKADAMLDGEQRSGEGAEGAKEEEKAGEKAVQEPGDILRELCRGKLKLLKPFRAHSQDVTEVAFDFCDLTGMEMMDALDSVPVNNMFAVTNAQAMALFAATAEKCAPYIEDGNKMTRLFDARDIRTRLGAADAVKAAQLAKLFYNASGQAGNRNISKD